MLPRGGRCPVFLPPVYCLGNAGFAQMRPLSQASSLISGPTHSPVRFFRTVLSEGLFRHLANIIFADWRTVTSPFGEIVRPRGVRWREVSHSSVPVGDNRPKFDEIGDICSGMMPAAVAYLGD